MTDASMASPRRRSAGFAVGLLALIAIVLASFAWRPGIAAAQPVARSNFDQATIDRGASLAAIGNCTGCHTTRDGEPYAGGLGIETPFGTVHSSNITPDAHTGIGAWPFEAFSRAMHDGVARDGRHLYPAFPYDHFTHSTDDDLASLYAFLMTRTPIVAETLANHMRFPFGFRPLVAGWNLLFLDRSPVASQPERGAEWNRGAYLTEALAHCGACHTPRNMLGAERRSEAFAGGAAEGWYAPPLDADSPSPQPWTVDAMTQYLRTGIAADHAMAGGPMQGVSAALAQASAADVHAIATYVVSLMGEPSADDLQRAATSRERAAAQSAQSAQAASAASFSSGAAIVGPQLSLGASVYQGACAGCHALGRTIGSGGALQLPLAVAVYDADPRSLLRIVREGIAPADSQRGRFMPAFGNSLTDEQLAALAAYLRQYAAQAPAWPDLSQAVRDSHKAL